MNEMRWFLTNFDYPSQHGTRLFADVVEQCQKEIAAQTETFLLDTLDRYAVYSFLYWHLLPVHLPALADQCSSKLPFTYASLVQHPGHRRGTHSARILQLCLLAGQTYFQPPDIIELAVRNTLKHRSPHQGLDVYPPQSTIDYLRGAKHGSFPTGRSMTADSESAISRTYPTLSKMPSH